MTPKQSGNRKVCDKLRNKFINKNQLDTAPTPRQARRVCQAKGHSAPTVSGKWWLLYARLLQNMPVLFKVTKCYKDANQLRLSESVTNSLKPQAVSTPHEMPLQRRTQVVASYYEFHHPKAESQRWPCKHKLCMAKNAIIGTTTLPTASTRDLSVEDRCDESHL